MLTAIAQSVETNTLKTSASLPIQIRIRRSTRGQVERRADQGEMGESLREVSQGLAAMPGLFRIEADMVGEAEHPLENQSGLLEPRPVVAACPGQRLDQPKRADVEGAFLSR